MAARLEDMGTVLTDSDLAALCQRAPSWPRRERDRAKGLGITPDLPAAMDQFRRPRYRSVDVEHWLRTGSRTRAPRLVRAS